jgi:hypothetical protein
MVLKSPDKQWNRQNSILFHETIPLNLILFNQRKKIVYILCTDKIRILRKEPGTGGYFEHERNILYETKIPVLVWQFWRLNESPKFGRRFRWLRKREKIVLGSTYNKKQREFCSMPSEVTSLLLGTSRPSILIQCFNTSTVGSPYTFHP